MQVQARFVIVQEENHRAYPFEWYLVLRQDEVALVKRSLDIEHWREFLFEQSDGTARWGWAGCCPLPPLEPAFPGLAQEIRAELQRQGEAWQHYYQAKADQEANTLHEE